MAYTGHRFPRRSIIGFSVLDKLIECLYNEVGFLGRGGIVRLEKVSSS